MCYKHKIPLVGILYLYLFLFLRWGAPVGWSSCRWLWARWWPQWLLLLHWCETTSQLLSAEGEVALGAPRTLSPVGCSSLAAGLLGWPIPDVEVTVAALWPGCIPKTVYNCQPAIMWNSREAFSLLSFLLCSASHSRGKQAYKGAASLFQLLHVAWPSLF